MVLSTEKEFFRHGVKVSKNERQIYLVGKTVWKVTKNWYWCSTVCIKSVLWFLKNSEYVYRN